MSEGAHGYAIRVRPSARIEIQQAYDRLADFPGVSVANRWYERAARTVCRAGVLSGALCTCPRKSSVPGEGSRRAARSLSSRSAVHRILFTIEEGGNDAPTVHVISVRHGARKPMTRAEAREIEETKD